MMKEQVEWCVQQNDRLGLSSCTAGEQSSTMATKKSALKKKEKVRFTPLMLRLLYMYNANGSTSKSAPVKY